MSRFHVPSRKKSHEVFPVSPHPRLWDIQMWHTQRCSPGVLKRGLPGWLKPHPNCVLQTANLFQDSGLEGLIVMNGSSDICCPQKMVECKRVLPPTLRLISGAIGFHCFIMFSVCSPLLLPLCILWEFSSPLNSKFGFHFGFAKALQGQLLEVGSERVSIAAKPWILWNLVASLND